MAKQNTSTDTASKIRTLSENDHNILRGAMKSLLGVLAHTFYVDGAEGTDLPDNVDDVMKSRDKSRELFQRAHEAVGVVRDAERKERIAKARTQVETTLRPIVAAQRTVYEAQRQAYDMALEGAKGNTMVLDLLKKSLQAPAPHTDVPLATIVACFRPGTTLEQIGGALKDMGYTVVSSRGPKATSYIRVLFAPEAPKSVPQLKREAEKQVSDENIFLPTSDDSGDESEESSPLSSAAE